MPRNHPGAVRLGMHRAISFLVPRAQDQTKGVAYCRLKGVAAHSNASHLVQGKPYLDGPPKLLRLCSRSLGRPFMKW